VLKAAWLVLLLGAGACRPAAAPATPVSKTGPIVASTGAPAVDGFTLFRAEGETKMLGKVQAYLEQQELISTLEVDSDGAKLLVPYEADDHRWTLQLRVIDSGGSERAIQVRVQGDFFVDYGRDEALTLKVINQHHRTVWGGTFSIDTDGEVLGRWALNLPSAAGLPASYVHDVIVRLGMAWQDLRQALLEADIVNLHG
jgi:hypothetical protein